LKKLKSQPGRDLFVNGSGKLIQTLLANQLVDELHTWTFPVTLGQGIRLFEEGTRPHQWKVTNTVVSTTGVIITTYIPDGEVKIGSFVPEKISEAEIARRKKWGIDE
jgi:dihydrofolate reductase